MGDFTVHIFSSCGGCEVWSSPGDSDKFKIEMAIVHDSLDDSSKLLLEEATQCQQNYYEICSDWNRYEKHEHNYLKDFIGYAFHGPPENKNPDNKDNLDHFVYDDKQRRSISLIYDKVIKHGKGKESNGIVLCGIIYNVVYNNKSQAGKKKSDKVDRGKQDNHSEQRKKDEKRNEEILQIQIGLVPILKVKQYYNAIGQRGSINKNNNVDKVNTEIIYYIDNSGRVYNGFQDYLKNNTLPECTMVLPKDGKYQMDPEICSHPNYGKENINEVVTKVWIEIHESPASNARSKALISGDIASTVVSLATMGVGVAAIMTPIGAGVALASAVGAGISGLWTIGRSVQQLADRNQHGESINVTDKSALGAWIGVAGGTMGLAATSGTVLLARAVRTGSTVGRAATVTYDAVLIGNLIVNGVGVGYKSYDMIGTLINGEKPSVQDIFLLTTHIFFFYNSVINIRLARSFIETSQGQLLKDYEASLRSNRHRKEFRRLSRNTRAGVESDISGNEEIIRGINKIANRDEFFQAMVRNRKTLSASSAKASFADGKVIVNSVLTIDPVEFANLPKNVRLDIVKGVSTVEPNNSAVSKPIRTNNAETSWININASENAILEKFCIKHGNAIIQAAPPVIANFESVLSDLRKVQSKTEIFLKLLEIGYRILQAIPREDLTVGDILAAIVQFLWDYVKENLRNIKPGKCIEDPSVGIILDKLVFELVILVEDKVDVWVQAFKKWLKNQLPWPIHRPTITSN